MRSELIVSVVKNNIELLPKRVGTIKKISKDRLLAVIFLGPALICFLIIVIIPFIMGIYYSMTSWNGVSDKITFVGFKNFIRIFKDENFINSFIFTFKYSIANVIIANVLAFLFALILTAPLKFRNALRTIFFLPNVISGLLLGFIWQFIFINGFTTIGEITGFSIFQLPWLGNYITGFWATVIVSVWQLTGYLMVIYIAGLTNVPRDLIEAAVIDGASRLQTLKSVTLPMIMSSITVCLFLSIAQSFKLFDLNFSLTHGAFDTRSIAFDIYSEAFTNSNFGLGTAKALVFFVVVATITILQVRTTKKREVQS